MTTKLPADKSLDEILATIQRAWQREAGAPSTSGQANRMAISGGACRDLEGTPGDVQVPVSPGFLSGIELANALGKLTLYR
jgi:hypothetical protein